MRGLSQVDGFDAGEALALEIQNEERAVPFVVVSRVLGTTALPKLDEKLAHDLAGVANVYSIDEDASSPTLDPPRLPDGGAEEADRRPRRIERGNAPADGGLRGDSVQARQVVGPEPARQMRRSAGLPREYGTAVTVGDGAALGPAGASVDEAVDKGHAGWSRSRDRRRVSPARNRKVRLMREISAQVTDETMTLSGPRGSVSMGVASSVEVERNDDDPACRDRSALEVSLETATPDDETVSPRTVVYVHTHDSYDGEHRDVLEENVVNEALIAEVLERVGAPGGAREFVGALAQWLPSFAPALQVLLDTWDDRYVPEGYPSGFLA